MTNRKKYLTVLLIFLILLFAAAAFGGYALVRHKRIEEKEIQRLDWLADQKQEELRRLTPVPSVTAVPTPTPKPTFTPTPTPVVVKRELFDPDDFWNLWYSSDGSVTVNVYQIDMHSIGFSYRQNSENGDTSLEADVSAEIAGNAAELAFTDSLGNYAEGSLVFDRRGLYLKVETKEKVEGVSLCPKVNSVFQRTQPVLHVITPTPVPEKKTEQAESEQNGEYFFADSASRYLTDEEMMQYSSEELMLAKNEIYARHGRKFVTDYISNYFAGKSWYQGVLDPDMFDAQADRIFNEYELANIQKIAEWEERKRSQGE